MIRFKLGWAVSAVVLCQWSTVNAADDEKAATLAAAASQSDEPKNAAKVGAKCFRPTIKTTGFSGHSYQMEHVMDETLAADDKIESNGAVLYIPKTNSWMLIGMEIGYAEDKMGSGFTFTNPNETGRCGCGESFSVERSE